MAAVGVGCGRIGRNGRVEIEGADENVHQAPDRDHHEETNKAPKHETLSCFSLLFVMSSLNEVLEDTPNEGDEGEREDDRHRDVVDKIDNDSARVIHAVYLREGEEREGEGRTDVAEFLHNV